MKQLITILVTFILLVATSLLWDIHWVRINPLRMIIVAILFLLIIFLGYRFYNDFAKAEQQNSQN